MSKAVAPPVGSLGDQTAIFLHGEGGRGAASGIQGALTSPVQSLILREFQTVAWALDGASLDGSPLKNDFEEAVFEMHPELRATAGKLRRLGARPARMTGSGSAVFGIFGARAEAMAGHGSFRRGAHLQ